MKRLTALLIALVMMLCTVPASASNRGVAGKYYSTDIRTYLNGVEIDSININGQTLISAEDMEYYSFEVKWYEKERLLDVHRTQDASEPPPAIKNRVQKPGKVLGNYYYTDIVTQLDGKPITAYNIGGRTYMHAEQMRDWGYTVDWNEAARTLSILSPDYGAVPGEVASYTRTLSIGKNPEGMDPRTETNYDNFAGEDGVGAFSISYENNKLTGCGDASLFDLTLACNGREYTLRMAFYQYEGAFFSGNLQKILNAMCYWDYGKTLAYPEEKYAFIAENATIIINGNTASTENVRVIKLGGNGHTDFEFEITGIPMYEKDKIENIYFSVGDTTGMETYEMEIPSQIPLF